MMLVIPENGFGIEPGYYTQDGLAALLHKHATQPEAVRFLADMIEEGTEHGRRITGEGACANEYAEGLVAYYNGLTVSSMFDPVQTVFVLRRVNRLGKRRQWWRPGRIVRDVSFTAKQVQPGGRAVRISVLSGGQVVDQATTTNPPTSDKEKVVIPLTNGHMVLEVVAKATWDAIIDTLDSNTSPHGTGFRLKVRRADLRHVLKLLKLCVASPEPNLYMPINAVYAHSTDAGVKLVSTDTYKLVVCEIDGALTVSDNNISTLVPPKFLELAANTEGEYATVTVLTSHAHDEDRIWAIEDETGNRTIYCHPLTRAKFPDYEKVLTEPTTHTVVLGTAANLITVLRPLLTKEDDRVRFLAADLGYTVNTEGRRNVVLPDSTGYPSFALNGKWLMSYLSTLPKEQQVVMSCKSDCAGVVTDPPLIFQGDQLVYAQVPMQL